MGKIREKRQTIGDKAKYQTMPTPCTFKASPFMRRRRMVKMMMKMMLMTRMLNILLW